jgi:hypothetical protein
LKKKVKWPVQQLVSRRKKNVLRRWLRKDKDLNDIEDMVCICETNIVRNLNDEEERLVEDLIDYEGKYEHSYFTLGNNKRSVVDLAYCEEGTTKISSF